MGENAVRLAARALPSLQTAATRRAQPQESSEGALTDGEQGCHVLLVRVGVFHLQGGRYESQIVRRHVHVAWPHGYFLIDGRHRHRLEAEAHFVQGYRVQGS